MTGSARTTSSLTDTVYRALRRELIDGTVPPGSRLVEEDIAERMLASRTPVREALRRLESDGFVQRRGARLITTPVGPDDLGDIALLRVELDGLAARLAVARATARDWERAQETVEQLLLVPDGDDEALAQAHAKVHGAVYSLGFSPRMSLFVENHVLSYIEVALSAGSSRTTPESTYRAHTALLRALSSGDPAHAEAVAREHARKGSRVAVRSVGVDQGGPRRSANAKGGRSG
jgi:DNA-binding GntR family transcriptional regulator